MWPVGGHVIGVSSGAASARQALSMPTGSSDCRSGIPLGGITSWHRRVLEAIDLAAVQSEGYVFQIECKYRAYQAGFRLVEAPIVFSDRRVGTSKMSTRIALEAVLRTWHLRGLRPQSLLSEKATE